MLAERESPPIVSRAAPRAMPAGNASAHARSVRAARGLLALLAGHGRSWMRLGNGVGLLSVLLCRILLLPSLVRLRRLVAHGPPPEVRVIGAVRDRVSLYHRRNPILTSGRRREP